MHRRWVVGCAVLLGVALATPLAAQARLKVGYLYVGPIGDYGWTHAHDRARKIVDRTLGTESLYVESVPEAQTEVFIDKLVQQGARVIFTTSFGFMDGTLAAARRYPNILFAHATGFKRAPNVATYMAELYQAYCLNGYAAGALTRTGTIAYVAAIPIPEVKRHVNAYALCAAAVNPRVKVAVRWTFEWFHPAKAKEATEALMAEGADVFNQTEDSPTVTQVAAKRGRLSFSHTSPFLRYAPRHVVSGQLKHWEVIYTDFLRKVLAGKYRSDNLQNVDYWWRLAEGAVEVGADFGMPINPVFRPRLEAVRVRTADLGTVNAYDLILRRLRQMSTLRDGQPVFEPFTGPIRDRRGVLRAAPGKRLTPEELLTMQWAAPNVVGPWPDEP